MSNGGFPVMNEVCGGTDIGTVTASSRGTQLTCGAANTKGSWVELSASTPVDAASVGIGLSNVGATAAFNFAFDIAVGASTQEKILIENLLLSHCVNNSRHTKYIILPLQIKGGSRVAARVQSPTASDLACINMTLFEGSLFGGESLAGFDDIGFVASTTLGTTMTGTSGTTKAPYVEFASAAARDYAGLFIVADTLNVQPAQNQYFRLDVAIGASGQEKIIIADMPFDRDYGSGGYILPNMSEFFPIEIPAGTRIACRIASSSGTTYAMGITLYGGYR